MFLNEVAPARNQQQMKGMNDMVRVFRYGGQAGALGLLGMLMACGILDTEERRPEKARVILDESNAEVIELQISRNFFVSENRTLSFQDLNTDTISLPMDQVYDIRQHARLYVRVTNILDVPISVHIKITIDGKNWYNETKPLDPEEDAQFVYRYQEPSIY
jgi:hypothetical protein